MKVSYFFQNFESLVSCNINVCFLMTIKLLKYTFVGAIVDWLVNNTSSPRNSLFQNPLLIQRVSLHMDLVQRFWSRYQCCWFCFCSWFYLYLLYTSGEGGGKKLIEFVYLFIFEWEPYFKCFLWNVRHDDKVYGNRIYFISLEKPVNCRCNILARHGTFYVLLRVMLCLA